VPKVLQRLKQHRVLNAVAALGLFAIGYFPVGGGIRFAGNWSGLLATLIAVPLLTCSALAVRLTGWRVLEAILGVLIMTVTGMLLLANLTELQYGPLFRISSIAAVLLAGGAYARLRPRFS
jgi:hypothetical protein